MREGQRGVMLYVETDVWEKLKAVAVREDRSVPATIRQAIKLYLESKEGKR